MVAVLSEIRRKHDQHKSGLSQKDRGQPAY